MFNAQGILNWSTVSAQFMIIAVGACMLMIAGEFDLSVGSMIGFAGMSIAIFAVTLQWPVWIAILLTFALCIAIGALNGFIVIRTGLPSFIVTLAFLFILRGFTIFFPQLIERQTIIGGIDDAAEGDWLAPVFGGKVGGFVFDWLADMEPDRRLLARHAGGRAHRRRHPDADHLGAGAGGRRASGADAHEIRQLDLRLGRRRAGGALCRRARQPGEDPDVHVHRLLRLRLRHLPGDGIRLGRGRPRPSEGVRGDHRGGDRRRASDRGLRIGHRARRLGR
jgi:hypothetical protein